MIVCKGEGVLVRIGVLHGLLIDQLAYVIWSKRKKASATVVGDFRSAE